MSDEVPIAESPHLPFEFLAVNGFIYRGNKETGEMWRLEPHPTEKKTQVWKKIAEGPTS